MTGRLVEAVDTLLNKMEIGKEGVRSECKLQAQAGRQQQEHPNFVMIARQTNAYYVVHENSVYISHHIHTVELSSNSVLLCRHGLYCRTCSTCTATQHNSPSKSLL